MNQMFWFILCFVVIALLLLFKGKGRGRVAYYRAQLKRVKKGGYFKQALLNQTEKASYLAIQSVLEKNHYLFAQVSLGEILKNKDARRYQDILSKRVDFLIVDEKFNPLAAVEIHGTGHYLGKCATLRDEIKKRALEDAKVRYIAIHVPKKEIYENVRAALLKKL